MSQPLEPLIERPENSVELYAHEYASDRPHAPEPFFGDMLWPVLFSVLGLVIYFAFFHKFVSPSILSIVSG